MATAVLKNTPQSWRNGLAVQLLAGYSRVRVTRRNVHVMRDGSSVNAGRLRGVIPSNAVWTMPRSQFLLVHVQRKDHAVAQGGGVQTRGARHRQRVRAHRCSGLGCTAAPTAPNASTAPACF